jgi:hypothetical protein
MNKLNYNSYKHKHTSSDMKSTIFWDHRQRTWDITPKGRMALNRFERTTRRYIPERNPLISNATNALSAVKTSNL